MGGACVKCGNNDPRVLDLDHIKPSEKDRAAHGKYPTYIRWRLWEKERDNLQILCANCHRIKTHEETWRTNAFICR